MSAETGIDLARALKSLQLGEPVAIPTETVYGLAANVFNPEAVVRIFEAKGRPSFDPLIVHIAAKEQLDQVAIDVPDEAWDLARTFWPGPLTLLLKKHPKVPDVVTAGLDQVGVRIPNHPLTLELLRRAGFPLAAPSANPFGYISPTMAEHVAAQLGTRVAYILDGGPCQIGLESTIIGFPNNIATVYRLGGLAVSVLETVVGKVNIMPHSSSNPAAPGMLKSHYAPRKPLRLINSETLEPSEIENERIGFLFFKPPMKSFAGKNIRVLAPSGDLSEAAHNLFRFLRELDAADVDKIYAELAPPQGLGLAINDRLRRAAA